MNLYLMRHCIPAPGAKNDPARGLTTDGKEQAEDMATFMVRQVGRVDIVISSPFVRAVETAKVMGSALGAHVVTTKELEPDSKPKEAWDEIKRLAQASKEVLVVGHHPDIGHLIDMLAGAAGISHAFHHGSIALVDPEAPILFWLVDHTMVKRESYIDAEEAGIIADLLEMADAGMDLAEALERRSLKHPDHQKLIAPIARKVKKLVAEYFQTQGAAILEAIKPWLKLHMKEASADKKPDDAAIIAESILPDTLSQFTLSVTTQQASDYRDLITSAIDKAAAMLDAELNSGGSIPETAMTRYLQENSLEKLTGGLDDTTKQRLRNAIAKTIREGGTSDDIVQTIRDATDDFSEKRAEMIAQTEVNDAYSFGRDGLARSAGLEEKNWIVESDNPCIVCIENEGEGWIPIDQDFSSGDAYPTAHPLCACGCDYRVRHKVQPLAAAA